MARKILIRATGQRGKRATAQTFDFADPSPTVQKKGLGDQRPRDVLVVDDGRREPGPTADAGKPPYRVPLVEEILALPRNGLTCMSTFSGCGGSCLGFEWAGYQPLLAVEFVPAAADSYEANHPGVPVFRDDIRTLTAQRALKMMGLRKRELDVLEGSPPCESFSTAGKLSAGWGTERNYCVAPNTKILKSDMTWTSAAWLEPGDKVVAFDEQRSADGQRKFRTAIVESAASLKQPCVEVLMDDGTEVVCSEDHRWLKISGHNLRWRRAVDLAVGDCIPTVGGPWTTNESREAGWLAGIFDGEGCVTKRHVEASQRAGPTLDRMISTIIALGYKTTISRGGGTNGDVVTVGLAGTIGDRMRFLGEIRPHRLAGDAHKLYEGLAIRAARKPRVVSVRKIGVREVIAVKTSEGTFIANGLLSHNSDGKVQRMDDLFYEFTRLLGGIQPRAFMAENVAGLARGVSKGYFQNIHRELAAQGYRVKARMLDAQWLGVPQRRKRVIFIGIRNDLKIDPVFPEPLSYRYSIRDALHDLARVESVSSRDGHEYTRKEIDPDEPVNTILRGGAALQRYEVVGVVGGWPRRAMSADEPAATIGKGGYTASGEHEVIERIVFDTRGSNFGKGAEELDLGKPSPTIVKSGAAHHYQVYAEPSKIVYENGGDGGAAREGREEEDLDAPIRAITKAHGASGHFKIERVVQGEYMVEERAGEPRKFTIAELRRLCGFPDGFVLTGSYAQQWERLGNSVPPPMAYHIAAAIRDALPTRAASRA